MMLRRLLVFRFHVELTAPSKVHACPRCFAHFLLHGRAPGAPRALPVTSASGSREGGSKRSTPSGFTGQTPEAKRQAAEWTVDDVAVYIEGLGLGHIKDKLVENAIDGSFLLELSEADLISELGLTKLQTKKVLTRLT